MLLLKMKNFVLRICKKKYMAINDMQPVQLILDRFTNLKLGRLC